MSPQHYLKAIVGALVAGLSALGVALEDGAVTYADGVTIALAVVTALATIWAVPNAQPELEPEVETATGDTAEGDPADDTVVEQPDEPVADEDDELVSEPI